MSKLKLLISSSLLSVILAVSCGSPNDYDAHANDKPHTIESTEHQRDTIQGRSAVQRDTGIEHSNTGIGDTTIEKTH